MYLSLSDSQTLVLRIRINIANYAGQQETGFDNREDWFFSTNHLHRNVCVGILLADCIHRELLRNINVAELCDHYVCIPYLAYHSMYKAKLTIHCVIMIPVIACIFRTYACCNTSQCLLLNINILNVK